MREIKFRAYDKTRKEYLSSGHIFLSINPGGDPAESVQYLDLLKDPNAYASRFVIEQFTGIVDKKGKAIYEGDIVRYRDPDFDEFAIGAVTYYSVTCSFVVAKDIVNITSLISMGGYEVIGNIHDNPNLLKQE